MASVQPALFAASAHSWSGSSQVAATLVQPTALTTFRVTRPPVWRDQKAEALATSAARSRVVVSSAAYEPPSRDGMAWTRVISCTAGPTVAAARAAPAVRGVPEAAWALPAGRGGVLVTDVDSTSRPAVGALSGPGRRAPTVRRTPAPAGTSTTWLLGTRTCWPEVVSTHASWSAPGVREPGRCSPRSSRPRSTYARTSVPVSVPVAVPEDAGAGVG